jgi:hypothetical protein
MEADNDNEELSFITLAAATANVTRYLFKEQNPDSKSETSEDHRCSEGRAREERRRELLVGDIGNKGPDSFARQVFHRVGR